MISRIFRAQTLERAGHAALCLVGAGMMLFWFAWIVPVQRAAQYDLVMHEGANGATWWQAQHQRARLSWQHDDFITIGENATKQDVPWILAKGAAGTEFDDCSQGHKAKALSIITNQTPGETKEDWEQWWEQHQHETQAAWILKGFEDYSIKVTLPLPREVAMDLLKIIGRGTWPIWKEPRGEDIPKNIRTNAMRLLRDVEFNSEDVTPTEIAADSTGKLLKGLLEYKAWRDARPLGNGVGVVFAGSGGIGRVSSMWIPCLFLIAWWGIAIVCLQRGVRGWRGRSVAK